jgi:hypothetical protein
LSFVDPFRNTTVEEFFKYEEDSNSNAYYYLNNFNSLPISGVTLFELTGEQIYVPATLFSFLTKQNIKR